MHYGREKRRQRTKIQRLIKYATTWTYGETLLDKANSVRTCVTYGKTPKDKLNYYSGTIDYGETEIALTYG